SYPTPDSDDNSFNENSESQHPLYSYDGSRPSVNEGSQEFGNQDRERKPRTYRSYGRSSDEERSSGDLSRGQNQYGSRPDYQDRQDYRRPSYGDNRYERRDQQQRPYRSQDNYRQSNYGSDRPNREYQNRYPRSQEGGSGGYRQDFRPRRDYGDRPQYGRQGGGYDNRGGGGYDNRGGGGYDNRRSYEQRSDYRPRREYGDRPQYGRQGGGYDNYERRPRQFDDRGYGEQRTMRPRNYGDDRYQQDYRGGGGGGDFYRNPMNRPITLVKAISKCDYGSPRICLRAIREGLVSVNGEIVTNPNARVRINRDMFEINGIPVNQNLDKMYIAVHKGRHFSGSNEMSVPSIYRLMKNKFGWFAPLGCLEIASSGMIIYTNDLNCKRSYGAELQNIAKTYRIKVHRPLQSIEEVTRIHDFVRTQTEEHVTVELEKVNSRNCWLRFEVRTSTPTDIRTALKEYGLETLAFERTAIGHLTVKNFHPGSWRRLDDREIGKLLKSAEEPIEPYIVPDDYKVVPPGSPVSKEDQPNKKAWRSIYKEWKNEIAENLD
ncbi:MAG: S4 domain-containing protein, partial [Candidatus Kapaibacteriota bacterium]